MTIPRRSFFGLLFGALMPRQSVANPGPVSIDAARHVLKIQERKPYEALGKALDTSTSCAFRNCLEGYQAAARNYQNSLVWSAAAELQKNLAAAAPPNMWDAFNEVAANQIGQMFESHFGKFNLRRGCEVNPYCASLRKYATITEEDGRRCTYFIGIAGGNECEECREERERAAWHMKCAAEFHRGQQAAERTNRDVMSRRI